MRGFAPHAAESIYLEGETATQEQDDTGATAPALRQAAQARGCRHQQAAQARVSEAPSAQIFVGLFISSE